MIFYLNKFFVWRHVFWTFPFWFLIKRRSALKKPIITCLDLPRTRLGDGVGDTCCFPRTETDFSAFQQDLLRKHCRNHYHLNLVSPMSAAIDIPKCKASQEQLFGENPNLRLTDDCPVCSTVDVRCPIGFHPSSGRGISYTLFCFKSLVCCFSLSDSF